MIWAARTFLLLLLALFSHQSFAAVCTNVFQNDNGENAGLTDPDEQLDLSDVPWSSAGSLPSGPLESGDYYVGGGNYDPIELSPGASVRIFIDGDLILGNNARINEGGDASKLLIVVRGNITAGNGAIISGLLYATEDIDIGQGQGGGSLPDITGGLAAEGEIDLPRRADVSDDYSGIDQDLLTGLCGGLVELLANGEMEGPVTVIAGNSVDFSVVAQDCPQVPPVFGDSEWSEQWRVDGNVEYSGEYDTSPCDRSPEWERLFEEPGIYSVEYTVERCSQRFWLIFFWLCTDYEEFDSDELTIEVVSSSQGVDHFEIVHDGVALTCQPETVEIRACANSSYTELITDISAVSLAPANGWIDGNTVALEDGRGSANIQITDFDGEVFSALLGVTGTTPSADVQSETLCEVGGALSAENCELLFFKSGLAFDVPDLISHRPSGPVQVRAVRQDDQTQACVPAFGDVTRVVQFSSAYVNPDADNRDVSRNVIVNSTPVSGDSNSPTGIGLSFDGNGVAEIDVSYPDAGLLRLSAVYVGSETTDDAGLIMPGSDNFVSVPAGFCVTSGGDCVAGDASCSAFRKAGQQFALSIKAVGWQSDSDGDFCTGNLTTPNFELADIPLEVELVAPNEADAVKGELPDNQKAYTHNRSPDATEVVNLSQSEVGVFRFKTAPEPGAYLGRDLPIAVSKPIGRFYPDRFRVTIQEGELGGECDPDDFVYTGQEFGWKLPASALIEPLSVQGDVTRNYTFDGFRRLFAGDITRLDPLELTALNTSDELMVLASDLGPAAFPVVGPGQMEYRYHSDDNFWFEKTLLAKRGPFDPTIQFALTDIQDSDGVETELSRYEFSPEMPAQVRYGRLVMENVYGPETIDPPLALKMPFEVEVFDGEKFARHQADNCTTWNTSGITVVEPPARHTLVASSGIFDDGMGDPLSIDPSGERGNDVLEWNVPVWLQGFWGREPVDSGDPAQDELQNPRATATFGVYRGNDRIIYWREVTD